MTDVLAAVMQDEASANVRRERNRAEFPELAAIVDQVRAAGGTARILWAAKPGYTIGPAPADALAVFGEG